MSDMANNSSSITSKDLALYQYYLMLKKADGRYAQYISKKVYIDELSKVFFLSGSYIRKVLNKMVLIDPSEMELNEAFDEAFGRLTEIYNSQHVENSGDLS